MEMKAKNLQNKKDSKKSERGQTSVEYILIIAVVVGVIIAFGGQMREQIQKITGEMFGGVSSGIQKSMN